MIKIIKAEEKHIPDICKLWWEFMKYSESFDPVFAPVEGAIPLFEKQELRPAMQNKNSLILVALDGKKVVGYGYSLIYGPSKLTMKEDKAGCIHDLFITRDCRRQGIGKTIYTEILKWFRSKDVNRIYLDVNVNNHEANEFWRKLGYTYFQITLSRKI